MTVLTTLESRRRHLWTAPGNTAAATALCTRACIGDAARHAFVLWLLFLARRRLARRLGAGLAGDGSAVRPHAPRPPPPPWPRPAAAATQPAPPHCPSRRRRRRPCLRCRRARTCRHRRRRPRCPVHGGHAVHREHALLRRAAVRRGDHDRVDADGDVQNDVDRGGGAAVAAHATAPPGTPLPLPPQPQLPPQPRPPPRRRRPPRRRCSCARRKADLYNSAVETALHAAHRWCHTGGWWLGSGEAPHVEACSILEPPAAAAAGRAAVAAARRAAARPRPPARPAALAAQAAAVAAALLAARTRLGAGPGGIDLDRWRRRRLGARDQRAAAAAAPARRDPRVRVPQLPAAVAAAALAAAAHPALALAPAEAAAAAAAAALAAAAPAALHAARRCADACQVRTYLPNGAERLVDYTNDATATAATTAVCGSPGSDSPTRQRTPTDEYVWPSAPAPRPTRAAPQRRTELDPERCFRSVHDLTDHHAERCGRSSRTCVLLEFWCCRRRPRCGYTRRWSSRCSSGVTADLSMPRPRCRKWSRRRCTPPRPPPVTLVATAVAGRPRRRGQPPLATNTYAWTAPAAAHRSPVDPQLRDQYRPAALAEAQRTQGGRRCRRDGCSSIRRRRQSLCGAGDNGFVVYDPFIPPPAIPFRRRRRRRRATSPTARRCRGRRWVQLAPSSPAAPTSASTAPGLWPCKAACDACYATHCNNPPSPLQPPPPPHGSLAAVTGAAATAARPRAAAAVHATRVLRRLSACGEPLGPYPNGCRPRASIQPGRRISIRRQTCLDCYTATAGCWARFVPRLPPQPPPRRHGSRSAQPTTATDTLPPLPSQPPDSPSPPTPPSPPPACEYVHCSAVPRVRHAVQLRHRA